MQSQCSCPKWYDVLDQDAVFALIDKYEAFLPQELKRSE